MLLRYDEPVGGGLADLPGPGGPCGPALSVSQVLVPEEVAPMHCQLRCQLQASAGCTAGPPHPERISRERSGGTNHGISYKGTRGELQQNPRGNTGGTNHSFCPRENQQIWQDRSWRVWATDVCDSRPTPRWSARGSPRNGWPFQQILSGLRMALIDHCGLVMLSNG